MLQVTGLSHTIHTGRAPLTILKSISCHFHAEEFISIQGRSGEGKTTLLSLLAGLAIPTSGQIFFENQDIVPLSEAQRAALRLNQVGFIFQDFQLLPHLTALDNVMAPLLLGKQVKAVEKAMTWLENVGLQDKSHQPVNVLSGGEQQRVAIARALAIEPKVLFIDEPTGSLDSKTGQAIFQLIKSPPMERPPLRIMVTHDDALHHQAGRLFKLVSGALHEESR